MASQLKRSRLAAIRSDASDSERVDAGLPDSTNSRLTIWSVTVHVQFPPGDVYRLHPAAYDRLDAILEGRGPIIKLERGKLVVVFGLRVEDLPTAQREVAPLVSRITDTLGLDVSAAVCIRMISTRELDEELSKTPVCAGVGEIAEILGVSKQRAHQIAQRADFPKPVQQLAATPLWHERDVRRFAETRNQRPGRPRRRTVLSPRLP